MSTKSTKLKKGLKKGQLCPKCQKGKLEGLKHSSPRDTKKLLCKTCHFTNF